MVTLESAMFARDPRPVEEGGSVLVSKIGFDHYTINNHFGAMRELLEYLPPIDPHANDVLKKLVPKKP